MSTGLPTSTTQSTEQSADKNSQHNRLASQLTAENIHEIMAYTLNRILRGQSTKPTGQPLISDSTAPATYRPAIHFKIFYQVNASPSSDLLIDTINEFREKCKSTVKFAFTVLPACSLQNSSTFLSICGIKHE